MKTIIICLISIMFFNFPSRVNADPESPQLPGNTVNEQELINSKTDIVIAKFISLGNASIDELGATYYERAQIQISSSLRGLLSGTIKISFSAKTFPKNEKDVLPTLNTEYILFIRNQKIDPDDYELQKIIPASAANLTRIKALVASKENH